jgi:hypothetical protein
MPAIAAVLPCLVVSVKDGDTLSARCDMPTDPDGLHVRLTSRAS